MENIGYADLYTANHSGSVETGYRNLILGIAYGQPRSERGAPSDLIYAAKQWSYAAIVVRDDGQILYPADGRDALNSAHQYIREALGSREAHPDCTKTGKQLLDAERRLNAIFAR